jgi:hypothetical protein
MIFGVRFGRFSRVISSMMRMPMRHYRMVRRLLMIAGLVVFSGFLMMLRRVLVVLGCLLVVFPCLF